MYGWDDTSHIGMTDWRKEMSCSVNLKFAINLMHSSRPAKTVNSPPNGFFLKYKSKLWNEKEPNQDEVDKAVSCNTFFPFIDLHLLKSNKKALETRFTESFMEALDRHTSWESLSHAVPKNTFRIPKIQVIIFPTVWVRYRWIILKNCCPIKIQWP